MTILTVLQGLPTRAVVPLALVGLVLLGVADFLSGADFSFLVFYAAAVAILAWHAGRLTTIVGTAIAAVATLVSQAFGPQAREPLTAAWNSGARFLFLLAGAWLLAELRSALTREERHARVDRLTLALNRFGFEERVELELSRARRTGGPLAAAVLDLDGLKAVNDQHGHQAGDMLLRRFSAAVQSAIRETDVFARVGGDEFALLLPQTGQADSCMVVDRILKLLATPTPPDASISASVGLAVWEEFPPQTADEIFAACDALMYEAKRSGGGRVLDLVVG